MTMGDISTWGPDQQDAYEKWTNAFWEFSTQRVNEFSRLYHQMRDGAYTIKVNIQCVGVHWSEFVAASLT